MEPKTFAIIVLSICVVGCVFQGIYAEQLGPIAVRQVAAMPRPLRAFYEWSSFGHPLDGPFWTRGRRIVAILVGAMMLATIGGLVLG